VTEKFIEAHAVKPGDVVRILPQETPCRVLQSQRASHNGIPCHFFKVERSGENFDIYVGGKHTVILHDEEL